jgi:hypothetical protein
MEGEKQVALPTEEQKGCTCTNVVNECPNGRHSMNLTSKSKPQLFRGDWGGGGVEGPKDEIKKTWKPFWKKLDKHDNAFDEKSHHIEKIRLHNQNIKHHKRPHSYPKGQ